MLSMPRERKVKLLVGKWNRGSREHIITPQSDRAGFPQTEGETSGGEEVVQFFKAEG